MNYCYRATRNPDYVTGLPNGRWLLIAAIAKRSWKDIRTVNVVTSIGAVTINAN